MVVIVLIILVATERLEIAESVKANGAAYEGDLTKQITHLISFRTEGAKYKAAKAWGLRIVSIEWLRDSLERGMILDERLYDPVLPIEERGKGAWDKTKRRTSLGKRMRTDSVAGLNGEKRKLRRTASAKLSSGNDEMWGDIVGGGTVPQVMRSGVWETTDDQEPANSTAATETLRHESARHSSGRTDALAPTQDIGGIFSYCRFFLDGFESKRHQILCDYMVPDGANLCSSMDGLLEPTQGVVRLFRVVSSSAPAPEPVPGIETVTEWWVERCIYEKAFLEPSANVLGRPFPKFPIEEFKGMVISSAAFSGMELKQLKQAVELIGAKYSEDMTPCSSVLVTRSIAHLRKDKSEHAVEWNIPVLSATWLWDSITAGEKLPYSKYACRKVRRSDSVPIEKRPVKQNAVERSRSELARSFSKSESSSTGLAKLHKTSRLDTSAFETESPVIPPVKEEERSQKLHAVSADPKTSTSDLKPPAGDVTTSSNSTSSLSNLSNTPTQPLTERSNNSPSRTVSTAPAPSNHPNSRTSKDPEDPDISFNISSLLAKTKRSAQPPISETSERRRGAQRILGRVTSNLSTTSVTSSVNSVNTPDVETTTPTTAQGDHIERFLDAGNDRNMQQDVDSQPPATQLNYEDPESVTYKERMMARMKGEKIEGRRILTKEKSVTLGDISGATGMRPRARKKPGFR